MARRGLGQGGIAPSQSQITDIHLIVVHIDLIEVNHHYSQSDTLYPLVVISLM